MEREVITNQNGETTAVTLTQSQPDIQRVDPKARERHMELLKAAKKVDPKTARSEVVQYWEASKGDELTAVLIGWKIIEVTDEKTGELKSIPAAILRAEDGDYINASSIVVDSLGGKVVEGSVVYIKCTESKSGKAKMFDVRTLTTPNE